MPLDRSANRQLLIRRLLARRRVSSQGELAALLAAAGHPVSQTTVSRDLAELGVIREADGAGRRRYRVATDAPEHHDRPTLRKVLAEYLEQAAPSGNLVVLKVRPATAGAVAAALDASPPAGVIGTVAGDDTVLVVVDGELGGAAVADRILKLMEAR